MSAKRITNNSSFPFLKTVGLTKQYSGNVVVDTVNLTFKLGEIHAIIGENGAGKSTLTNMLSGAIRPDGGSIVIKGDPVIFNGPRDASNHGISMVYQELQLVPTLSVIDNLMLIRPVDSDHIRRRSRAELKLVQSYLDRVGLKVKPNTLISELSVAQAQLLEIAKVLSLNAQLIIFDEPTSALPPKDVESLLQLIEYLREQNHAIIYISHKLGEVTRLADVITVMRNSKIVGQFKRGEATERELIRLMVDRPSKDTNYAHEPFADQTVLSVDNLSTDYVRNISFELHKGEILGFAGLIGAGMVEVARALYGDVRINKGEVYLNGKKCRFNAPVEAVKAGIAFVPEERKLEGIIPDGTVNENMHVGRMQRFSNMGFVNRGKMWNVSEQLVKQFNIRLRNLQQPIRTLSGGNQQKAVLARCISTQPHVLILAEPTRGIDVGSKAEIHELIIELSKQGKSIILISSELEEVLALSHRVVVFCEGEVTGILEAQEITSVKVMSLASPKGQNNNGKKEYVYSK